VTTPEFLAAHPVFSLGEATRALRPPGGRAGAVQRLKHHVAAGRLTVITRGVYAVLPPGSAGKHFHPDPFLVAAAVRPDAVFSHHAALDLLGSSHSAWTLVTAYTAGRRHRVKLERGSIKFLEHPAALRGDFRFGTRRIERRGRLLASTGPERTLVEGFRRPALVGGIDELIESARAFPVLDLDLLEAVLTRYDVAYLWAAAGWFLEIHEAVFHVPPHVLARFEHSRPRFPQYLSRGERGGTLIARWNLIVPASAAGARGTDEP
jgi:predicted transcriptional regulator of viral defense system